jgi:hypothetical protein
MGTINYANDNIENVRNEIKEAYLKDLVLFLKENPLADEVFFLKRELKNDKKALKVLKKDTAFNDLSKVNGDTPRFRNYFFRITERCNFFEIKLKELQEPQQGTIETVELKEFNYEVFFNKIDSFSSAQLRNIIQKETNNFDVFLLCCFYSEFINLVSCYKLEKIKFNSVDITFPKNLDDKMLVSSDNSHFPFYFYKLDKGVLVKKAIIVKYDLKDPIPINYYVPLYNFLWSLETIILNYVTKEQLNSVEPQQPETEPLDLSDSSGVEKIIYLNELGIIDFLRTKTTAGISNSGLASVLSGITGMNPDTIKSSLNRLPKDNTIDNKHPYYTEKTVSKIKTFLAKLGF